MDFNTSQMLSGLVEKAITTSKQWSPVAHKRFVEMVEKHRNDIMTKGDLSFINEFRTEFGIPEAPAGNYGLGGPTLETTFIKMMQPIWEHFGKIAREYEQQQLRESYLAMLRSGRKDELLALMQVEQERINTNRRMDIRYPDSLELQCMQAALQQINQEEALRIRKEQDDQRMLQATRLQEIKRQREIEAEAKRRLEREKFEAAVQAKMNELR